MACPFEKKNTKKTRESKKEKPIFGFPFANELFFFLVEEEERHLRRSVRPFFAFLSYSFVIGADGIGESNQMAQELVLEVV